MHVDELRRMSLVSQVNGGKLASSRVLFDRTRKKGKFRQRESIARATQRRDVTGKENFRESTINERIETELGTVGTIFRTD